MKKCYCYSRIWSLLYNWKTWAQENATGSMQHWFIYLAFKVPLLKICINSRLLKRCGLISHNVPIWVWTRALRPYSLQVALFKKIWEFPSLWGLPVQTTHQQMYTFSEEFKWLTDLYLPKERQCCCKLRQKGAEIELIPEVTTDVCGCFWELISAHTLFQDSFLMLTK